MAEKKTSGHEKYNKYERKKNQIDKKRGKAAQGTTGKYYRTKQARDKRVHITIYIR